MARVAVGDLEPIALDEPPPPPVRRRWWPLVVGAAVAGLLALWWVAPHRPAETKDAPRRPVLRMVGIERDVLVSVDLATGAPIRRDLDLGPDAEVVGRDGYVAYVSGGQARTLPYDLHGTPRDLGPAHHLVPALDAKAVWLVRGDTAVRVDDRGRPMSPLYRPRFEGSWRPVAEVRNGFVLDGTGVLVWDPRTDRVRRSFPTGDFIAAGSHTLSYGTCEGERCQLHLVDLAGGGDRVVGARSSGAIPRAGALSPDGRTLAAMWTRPDTSVLVLLDVATGRIRSVVPEPRPVHNLIWSPDGRRLVVVGPGAITVHRVDGTGLMQLPWSGQAGGAVGIG